MKLTTTTLAAILLATTVYAGPNATSQINSLPNGAVKDAMRELNNEDQRLTDGTYDPNTGTLTLYTQDMKAGADGDIARRPVVIEGIQAKDGVDGQDGINGLDGIDGQDGKDYDPSALASVTALSGLNLPDLTKGEFGWAAGFGGQFDTDGAFAFGLAYGVTDTMSINGGFAVTPQGNGASGFLGMSGKF